MRCQQVPTASSPVASLLSLLALMPMGLSAPAMAAPAQSSGCSAPRLGRYAVMGMGTVKASGQATPEARLLEERWLPGGVVQGTVIERLGKLQRTAGYKGSVKLVGTCLARVNRELPWGVQVSEAVLDGKGRPLYSLDRDTGTVITGRWLPMAPGACKPADLNGVVLSSQVGVTWEKGGWRPNAVVQREEWRDGGVKGIALSSTDGVGDTEAYSGTLKLDANSCWASLSQRDAKGTPYNYRALIVNGRAGARGYLYLQNDPTDLTVGWLVRD